MLRHAGNFVGNLSSSKQGKFARVFVVGRLSSVDQKHKSLSGTLRCENPGKTKQGSTPGQSVGGRRIPFEPPPLKV